MKTSNILMTTLLGSMLLFILISATDMRLFGVHKSDRHTLYDSKTKDLPDFSVLAIENMRGVHIIPSGENRIKLFHWNEDVYSSLYYDLKGDTLFILKSPLQKFTGYEIHVDSSFNSLISNNSLFILSGFYSGNIKVSMDNSELNNFSPESSSQSHFEKLEITATNNSAIYYNTSVADTVDIQLSGSRAQFFQSTTTITAVLENSELTIPRNFSGFQLEKDSLSRVIAR